MRFFNTAGPVNSERNYCLPPLHRFNLPDILQLIDQQKYFVLHGSRPLGKTSFLFALQDYLNKTGNYRCLYVNVEVAQTAGSDVEQGIEAILNQLSLMARTTLNDDYPEQVWRQVLVEGGAHTALNRLLTQWEINAGISQGGRPLVLLIDEVNALVGDTLTSMLHQLQVGYPQRPAAFPQSVILCGIHDILNYPGQMEDRHQVTIGSGAFNIKAESFLLGDFVREEVEQLYRQHTEETGQQFTPEALDLLWGLSQGQPWLVNALGYELCFRIPAGQDRSQPITADMVIEAKENLILHRETHLNHLADLLKEEPVRRVIASILAGETEPELLPDDDVQYVIERGLVTANGHLRIANPIYQEIIPRILTFTTQVTIRQEAAWYLLPDGRLDFNKLLTAFQHFYQEHSENWMEQFEYKKAGPQLLIQAFLQRVINGCGRVEREYGLGRQRTDLLITWPYNSGQQRTVIELKTLYQSLEQTLETGLQQTTAYRNENGAAEGHLVIFNRQPDQTWRQKLFHREKSYQGQTVTIWGM